MGKTLFVAIVAAVLASVATTILLGSFDSPEKRAARARFEQQEREIERLTATLDTLERRQAAHGKDLKRVQGSRHERSDDAADVSRGPGPSGADGAAPLAPDGTPYVSRADLESFLAEHEESLLPRAGVGIGTAPVTSKTLDEVIAEMGMSVGEEAQVRIVLRETEEEMMQIFFGDRSIEEVKQELSEAKDDPDKQAALIQRVLPRLFANAGNLATMELRQKKKLQTALGKERAAEFLEYDVQSENAELMEELFEDL